MEKKLVIYVNLSFFLLIMIMKKDQYNLFISTSLNQLL